MGSLLFKTSDPTILRHESFQYLYQKRSTMLSFGRIHDDMFPNCKDNMLNCRFRFFFRYSYTSGLTNIPFTYVDWIQFTNMECNSSAFTVGTISEVEWTTGPKQRSNQWSKPPFVPLDSIVASRYGIGMDPDGVPSHSKAKKVVIFSLDPDRLGDYQPKYITELGDEAFPEYQQTQLFSTTCEPADDSSSSSNAGDVESSTTYSITTNVIDFLEMYDTQKE